MAVKAAVVGYTERFVRGEGPKEGETEPVKIDHEGEAFLTEEELNNLDKQDLDGLAMSVDMGSDDEDGEDSVRKCKSPSHSRLKVGRRAEKGKQSTAWISTSQISYMIIMRAFEILC